ncbi:hypothetical protein TNCV_4867571 [Trichonephila clavipes]|nr:hypothetical protein TNCV_4867571 [Trichonephila clavipes]
MADSSLLTEHQNHFHQRRLFTLYSSHSLRRPLHLLNRNRISNISVTKQLFSWINGLRDPCSLRDNCQELVYEIHYRSRKSPGVALHRALFFSRRNRDQSPVFEKVA